MSLVVAVGLAMFLSMTGLREVDEAGVATWVAQHYSGILDTLLPVGPIPHDEMPRDAEWVVRGRVLEAGQPEFQFTIWRYFRGATKASLRSPRGQSLQVQLERVRTRSSSHTRAQLIEQVAITEVQLSSQQWPDLQALSDEVPRLVVPVVPSNSIVMDGVCYEISIQATYGNNVQLRLCNPRNSDALPQWMEAVRRKGRPLLGP
jgi:hypothetical protein